MSHLRRFSVAMFLISVCFATDAFLGPEPLVQGQTTRLPNPVTILVPNDKSALSKEWELIRITGDRLIDNQVSIGTLKGYGYSSRYIVTIGFKKPGIKINVYDATTLKPVSTFDQNDIFVGDLMGGPARTIIVKDAVAYFTGEKSTEKGKGYLIELDLKSGELKFFAKPPAKGVLNPVMVQVGEDLIVGGVETYLFSTSESKFVRNLNGKWLVTFLPGKGLFKYEKSIVFSQIADDKLNEMQGPSWALSAKVIDLTVCEVNGSSALAILANGIDDQRAPSRSTATLYVIDPLARKILAETNLSYVPMKLAAIKSGQIAVANADASTIELFDSSNLEKLSLINLPSLGISEAALRKLVVIPQWD